MATKAATTMDEINTAVDGRLSRLLYLHVQEITRIMFEPWEPNNPHIIQIIALLQIMVVSVG